MIEIEREKFSGGLDFTTGLGRCVRERVDAREPDGDSDEAWNKLLDGRHIPEVSGTDATSGFSSRGYVNCHDTCPPDDSFNMFHRLHQFAWSHTGRR